VTADKRIRIATVAALVAVVGAAAGYLRRDHEPLHFTGFVEGEERVIRSEVLARVREVKYDEGDEVPADAAIAALDDRDIVARIHSKEHELAVLDAQLRNQQERVALIEATWERDTKARKAELEQARAAAELARRTLNRNQELFKKGSSTAQELDESLARRDEAESGVVRAGAILDRVRAQEREITVARNEVDTLKSRRELAGAVLDELHVTHSKYVIRAPAARTVMQTRFLRAGELAQPGTPVATLLDPLDKYIQLYVPVSELGSIQVGQKVWLEPDSEPERRYPAEISFIADQAGFTPEKIETRDDRMTQVYRVKARVLDGVERLKPGTEGNVYLDAGAGTGGS
jgi:HlyD family secretion protein